MHHTDDIGFLIKLINESIVKKANQNLKPFDLTLSQARILFYLRDHPETTTSQKDLEEHFEVSHPTIIGILSRLEKKDFIWSEFDRQDKRVKNIFLTDTGLALVSSMDDNKRSNDQQMLKHLTPAQISELQSLLKIVYQNAQQL
jgi:DNA-binding MarR family transcriptional regulator